MQLPKLTAEQVALVERPLDARTFLQGPAGAGKTTVAVERMLYLMERGVAADSILILVPQRTLAAPYHDAIRHPGVIAGGTVTVVTIGGLARRMVELFWALVAEPAGFTNPDRPPTFLTLETAQYYMARLVRPLLSEGAFESVVIDRNRLYSQILDNLNKAASVGFAHTEIARRLGAAAVGDPAQKRIYDDAQKCATRFREYCLAHNLLDFSLQLEIFIQHLWPYPLCQEYLVETYLHLIVDNLEENPAIAHDLLVEWLPQCESALLVYDTDAGYRYFLGADPLSAQGLKPLCPDQVTLSNSFVASPEIEALAENLIRAIDPEVSQQTLVPEPRRTPSSLPLRFDFHRYYPQMLDWVAGEIADLVFRGGILPGEIAVLAPFLNDALRFSLTERLKGYEVPVHSHRPSRALREEPVTRCLLTLAALAHPAWPDSPDGGTKPTSFDVESALIQAISQMDLVRAQLLTRILYRQGKAEFALDSFDQIQEDAQERITYSLGERFEGLRLWLLDYSRNPEDELDHFFSRLFGEVLSQPGYGFHYDYRAAEITANLVESVQKFRWVVGESLVEAEIPLGVEYLRMVQEGVIAALYIRGWQVPPQDAVLLAPAYTFLTYNRTVDYQFWLDIGSRGWNERIYQPLTHPYVLSRYWPLDRAWTDEDEIRSNQAALNRLSLGLLRRCRREVYLGYSELSEQGYEGRGALLRSIDRAMRWWSAGQEVGDV